MMHRFTKYQFSAALLAAAAVAGCASYPPSHAPAVEKTMVFSVSYETAWKKMLEAVTQEGELLTTSDKSGGVIGLQRNIAPGDIDTYARDDTGMFWSQAMAQAIILLTPQDERSTSITINLKVLATGRDTIDVLFSRTRQMTLHSSGYLEKYYFSAFSKLLAAIKKQE